MVTATGKPTLVNIYSCSTDAKEVKHWASRLPAFASVMFFENILDVANMYTCMDNTYTAIATTPGVVHPYVGALRGLESVACSRPVLIVGNVAYKFCRYHHNWCISPSTVAELIAAKVVTVQVLKTANVTSRWRSQAVDGLVGCPYCDIVYRF